MEKELAAQVASHQSAAAAAARRVEPADDSPAAEQARQQKQDNERTAASFQKQLAEQREQSADIKLRLAKVDSTLTKLRNERGVLNARLKTARAQWATNERRPQRQNRRFLIPFIVAAGILGLLFVTVLFSRFPTRGRILRTQLAETSQQAQAVLEPPVNSVVRKSVKPPIVLPGPKRFGSTEPGWHPISSMAHSRADHTAIRLLDGRVFVAGGTGPEGPWATCEIYEDNSAIKLPDGSVLAIGSGSRGTEIYDPRANTWSAAGNLQEIRQRFTATLLDDGRVIVVGGENDLGQLASAAAYSSAKKLSAAGPRGGVAARPVVRTPQLPSAGGTGLLGRTVVADNDIGLVFHYETGKPLTHSLIQQHVFEQGGDRLKDLRCVRGVAITLNGTLVVPRSMTVIVWHKGGSSTGGVHRLYVDGREVGSIGDDRTKDTMYRLPLEAGEYPVRWVLTGGDFGTSVLQFFDPDSKLPLKMNLSAGDISAATQLPIQQAVDNFSAGLAQPPAL